MNCKGHVLDLKLTASLHSRVISMIKVTEIAPAWHHLCRNLSRLRRCCPTGYCRGMPFTKMSSVLIPEGGEKIKMKSKSKFVKAEKSWKQSLRGLENSSACLQVR